ncbi:hypothetical protein [Halosolutus halophilus]|uniref:hypothetical protein n=1 Tax=Halosolutus halophilus TaxID=1552990 RepID=UPI002235300A|nr:hypothetical protein [Halosolutus halophilus]
MDRGSIALYMATSVDGFIATVDGGVSWLDTFESSDRVTERYDAFFADVDCWCVDCW